MVKIVKDIDEKTKVNNAEEVVEETTTEATTEEATVEKKKKDNKFTGFVKNVFNKEKKEYPIPEDIQKMIDNKTIEMEAIRMFSFFEAAYYNGLSQEEYEKQFEAKKFTITVDEAMANEAAAEIRKPVAIKSIRKYVEGVVELEKETDKIVPIEQAVKNHAEKEAEKKESKKIEKVDAEIVDAPKEMKVATKKTETKKSEKKETKKEAEKKPAKKREPKVGKRPNRGVIGTVPKKGTPEYKMVKEVCDELSDELNKLDYIPKGTKMSTGGDGFGNFWATIAVPGLPENRFSIDAKVNVPNTFSIIWTDIEGRSQNAPLESAAAEKLILGRYGEITNQDNIDILKKYYPFGGKINLAGMFYAYDFRAIGEHIMSMNEEDLGQFFNNLANVCAYVSDAKTGDVPRMRFVNFEWIDNFSVVSDDDVWMPMEASGDNSAWIDLGLRVDYKVDNITISHDGEVDYDGAIENKLETK